MFLKLILLFSLIVSSVLSQQLTITSPSPNTIVPYETPITIKWSKSGWATSTYNTYLRIIAIDQYGKKSEGYRYMGNPPRNPPPCLAVDSINLTFSSISDSIVYDPSSGTAKNLPMSEGNGSIYVALTQTLQVGNNFTSISAPAASVGVKFVKSNLPITNKTYTSSNHPLLSISKSLIYINNFNAYDMYFTVYNINGVVVYKTNILKSQQELNWDYNIGANNLKTGCYLVVLKDIRNNILQKANFTYIK
jgi:hypothetical protein